MKPENKSLRIGALAVAGSVLLRLISGNLPQKLIGFFSKPETMATILFLETGTLVHTPREHVPEAVTEPTETVPVQWDKPVFSSRDESLVSINNSSGKKTDVAALLQRPLDWDLADGQPRVLILHTHTSESYADCSENYRSLDENCNLLAVGKLVEEALTAAGIGVIRDTTIHDYPSYNGSYSLSRKTAQKYLEESPSIILVLDIHRDAMEDKNGKQYATRLSVNGNPSAQLMMVVGTNSGGLNHPNWQENLSLAVKFHAQLERMYPGICRPISLRSQRFNQDLSDGAMLIEVGTAANSQSEAMVAARCLCDAIVALSRGTQ